MADTNLFVSKSDYAYAELRGQILSGTLPAGARLAQYDLAESLNMSITPLREAIRRLSSEGLVTVETHRDVRVSTMSSDEARQLFEVRLSLDPTAAELAARRRTGEDVAVMRSAVTRLLPVTRQWGEEALTAHRAFHQALYRASHNDVLIRLLDDLWDKSDRYRRLGLELPPGDEPRTRDLEEHHRLVDLVEDGRATEAAQLMRDHITHSLTATAISALEDREGVRTG
ncbi:GntR family transcriptional regulator [Streptomyces griseoviridis]|uniref:GntR family transcriptional regulator n=3 Tax=Streptomyces TaxID=1883 RepID=A0A918GP83_STRGD|nr:MULTISPECIES: GntR family transcriptional regulator [Streptomyces]MDP9684578.1 DNA-binding GntR family transcriptional regulator [Streptomyces griseoviridis]GGS51966.1 GntR family transcriptional regulator [Streptomyces niveoruber]GGT06576.1 GntR family transcriptional regulator [Streptomyces griseoviridis]GGU70717.1 GntR family transcriptional regulator [Streptomyces daghestanicus]GHI30467.1 GntR family transcriptional regulator [Streptomyces daghestanicus]